MSEKEIREIEALILDLEEMAACGFFGGDEDEGINFLDGMPSKG